jgi:peptide/nickel transport system ATP-binding protein
VTEAVIDTPSPATDAARLSVHDLRIAMTGERNADVVDEVSFEVRTGEVLGLVGESGSGKTTVALALLGYARRGLVIESGSVVLDGLDILSLSTSELRRLRGEKVAYVPQDPASALNPALKINTQLSEAMRSHPHAVDDVGKRMTEVLDEVRLPESLGYLKRYPHQMSGGQQQRVGLAMAFSCRPSLIVPDEPTTGLDVTTQRHVLDTIRKMCSAYGVAAVYVSHDLAVVGGLVSSVAVMYAGRIAEYGPTEDVFGSPVHPYTRRLLAAIPSPERSEILQGIEGQPPRPGKRPKGCFFAPRCDLRMDKCSEDPPLVDVASRKVRCWRADEESELGAVVQTEVSERSVTGDAVLELRNLDVSYSRTQVLHGVSLDLPAECCVAIVGESGSGKTTLARTIVGLHTTFTGQILYKGEELPTGMRKRSKEQLRRIQYIFQNPYTSLNPRKTIGQIVSQPLEHFFDFSRNERQERVGAVLRDVSLSEEFIGRFPDQLSGGERQRVAIARALVVDPELLVCDEVTSALDVSVQAVIVELLRRLQSERHLSMLFITHNLALVRSIAQSVVVLASGTVVESGTVRDVLEHPSDPYTARLMEDVPKLSIAGAGREQIETAAAAVSAEGLA